jgi:hypothetical protein
MLALVLDMVLSVLVALQEPLGYLAEVSVVGPVLSTGLAPGVMSAPQQALVSGLKMGSILGPSSAVLAQALLKDPNGTRADRNQTISAPEMSSLDQKSQR